MSSDTITRVVSLSQLQMPDSEVIRDQRPTTTGHVDGYLTTDIPIKVQYNVLTWISVLSPIVTGNYTSNTTYYRVPCTLRPSVQPEKTILN